LGAPGKGTSSSFYAHALRALIHFLSSSFAFLTPVFSPVITQMFEERLNVIETVNYF